MTTLHGPTGPVECHEPRPGCYFAASHWTAEEAEAYAATGKYPQRLSDEIRAEYEVSQ